MAGRARSYQEVVDLSRTRRPAPTGGPRRSKQYYVDIGKRVLNELAEEQLAFVWQEAEARASDTYWRGLSHVVDPEHLATARDQLLSEGTLVREPEVMTKGGHGVIIFRPANLVRRRRAFEDVASRKRALQGRFLGWAQGGKEGAGIIGKAGELVLLNSLRAASPIRGYRLENPENGECARLLDLPVPGYPDDGRVAPLDNGAYVFIAPTEFALSIEMKSTRNHIYPASAELHQVLYKAAALQRQRPLAAIVPVLVCRAANWTTLRMAKDLGFLIVTTRTQWLIPQSRVTEANVLEVRRALGYDVWLPPQDWISPYLRDQFAFVLPNLLEAQAKRWSEFGAGFEETYGRLWRFPSTGTPAQRRSLVHSIRRSAIKRHGPLRGW